MLFRSFMHIMDAAVKIGMVQTSFLFIMVKATQAVVRQAIQRMSTADNFGGNLCPLPETLRLIAQGADILLNDFQRSARLGTD